MPVVNIHIEIWYAAPHTSAEPRRLGTRSHNGSQYHRPVPGVAYSRKWLRDMAAGQTFTGVGLTSDGRAMTAALYFPANRSHTLHIRRSSSSPSKTQSDFLISAKPS